MIRRRFNLPCLNFTNHVPSSGGGGGQSAFTECLVVVLELTSPSSILIISFLGETLSGEKASLESFSRCWNKAHGFHHSQADSKCLR